MSLIPDKISRSWGQRFWRYQEGGGPPVGTKRLGKGRVKRKLSYIEVIILTKLSFETGYNF